MYSNEGDEKLGVPPHWHYVTYGFTDLHGDDRVHSFTGRGLPSGFGFELTFRLKKVEGEQGPPMWPTTLLNKLATYVFQTGNVLHVGDHIPWHQPLDGSEKSRIQHMLVAEEPQLLDLDTPYGVAQFRQIVGVTDEEVKSAQRWKGAGILELLEKEASIGPFFITDMTRDKSIFEIDPSLVQLVNEGIEKDGSNLGHVTALCAWQNLNEDERGSKAEVTLKSKTNSQLGGGEGENTNSVTGTTNGKTGTGGSLGEGDTDTAADDKEKRSGDKEAKAGEKEVDTAENGWEAAEEHKGFSTVDAIKLLFDVEAAELLPLIIKGRLGKGRFFIFHNAEGQAIHFVPPELVSQDNVMVNPEEPIKCAGRYLQIFCTPSLMDEIASEFEFIQETDKRTLTEAKEIQLKQLPIVVKVTPKGGPLDAPYFKETVKVDAL
nr:hypothetical protein BaRGS_000313 [Batillaria attramentaria]